MLLEKETLVAIAHVGARWRTLLSLHVIQRALMFTSCSLLSRSDMKRNDESSLRHVLFV